MRIGAAPGRAVKAAQRLRQLRHAGQRTCGDRLPRAEVLSGALPPRSGSAGVDACRLGGAPSDEIVLEIEVVKLDDGNTVGALALVAFDHAAGIQVRQRRSADQEPAILDIAQKPRREAVSYTHLTLPKNRAQ